MLRKANHGALVKISGFNVRKQGEDDWDNRRR